MLNPNLVKFMIKNNLEESAVEPKKEKKVNVPEVKLAKYTQFAAIPVQVIK